MIIAARLRPPGATAARMQAWTSARARVTRSSIYAIGLDHQGRFGSRFSDGNRRTLSRSSVSLEEQASSSNNVPVTDPVPSLTAVQPTARKYVRKTASFYISNVLPIRLGRFDPRHLVAALEEDALLERLEAIAQDVVEEEKRVKAEHQQEPGSSSLGFRVEGWEIARKDGGIFLNYSYRSPVERNAAALPPPPKLLLAKLTAAAKQRGGFPSWLGNWWATAVLSKAPDATSAGDRLDSIGRPIKSIVHPAAVAAEVSPEETEDPSFYETRAERKRRLMLESGDGRCWNVKGRQWTEVRTKKHWSIPLSWKGCLTNAWIATSRRT